MIHRPSIGMLASVNFLRPDHNSPVFPHLQSELNRFKWEADVLSSQLNFFNLLAYNPPRVFLRQYVPA